MLTRFHWRVAAVLLGVLLGVQSAVWLAVDASTDANAREQAGNRLAVGARVLRQLLDARGQQLRDSVAVIVADFGFKQAVATRDLATIEGMLVNHGARIGAASVLLLDNDGTVLAATEPVEHASDRELLARQVGEASRTGSRIDIVELRGRPTQVALVPVRAPTRVGWVAMGFVLDDPLLARLRDLTSLHVSLLAADGRSVAASTLPEAARMALAAQAPAAGEALQTLRLAGDEYLATRTPLAGLQAVLQLDRAQVHAGFEPLRERLLTILLAGSLLGVIGALLLARGISQPLLDLAQAAAEIGRGRYQALLPLRRRDELGVLARAFGRMQEDIAEREATIAHQAWHDALTDLPNRAQAQRHLERALERSADAGRPLAVLMLDLDRFKEINDTLGHPIGDRVLVEAAARLRGALRDDDLLARLGGDEFLVVVEGADGDEAEAVAQRLLGALEQPLAAESMELFVDASVGIALAPVDHGEADGLIRRADIAMYDAKQGGRGIARYQAGRDAGHAERLALVNDLRRAVPRGEFRLHFQPKWDLAGGHVGHAEALVRWAHPQRGLLGPDLFVPLAEHSGRIRELTDWVLREALANVAAWQRAGLTLGVAVNLSALDLVAADLPERVRALLDEHAVPPRMLLLEITESMVMRDAAHALAVLHRLRALGIELAIDDFGTGYSSLSHLRRLPVSELKIDKSFVRDLARNQDDDVIVRSTIELGHNMGLRVVAEGVEDAATLARLGVLNCDQVQGYLVARPMPGADIPGWLHEHASRLRGAA